MLQSLLIKSRRGGLRRREILAFVFVLKSTSWYTRSRSGRWRLSLKKRVSLPAPRETICNLGRVADGEDGDGEVDDT